MATVLLFNVCAAYIFFISSRNGLLKKAYFIFFKIFFFYFIQVFLLVFLKVLYFSSLSADFSIAWSRAVQSCSGTV